MHAAIEKNSWRLPPEDIVQVADPRSKKVQELVYEESEGRNWRSIVLSLAVISTVISGIVCAIYVLGYVDELLYFSGERMKLDQFLRGDFRATKPQPMWVDSSHFVFQDDDYHLVVYDSQWDNITRLVENNTVRNLNVKWFQCTRDLKYVLLRHSVKMNEESNTKTTGKAKCEDEDSQSSQVYMSSTLKPGNDQMSRSKASDTMKNDKKGKGCDFKKSEDFKNQSVNANDCLGFNPEEVFKHTSTAFYTIYDVDKDHHMPVRLSSSSKVGASTLQSAGWCGSTHRLVMVAENDIYVRHSPLDATDHRVTTTGSPKLIYNGVPDWLYQENILKDGQTWWCPEDGELLLYATFNDSEVSLFTFPWIEPVVGRPPAQSTYSMSSFPGASTVRYPTAGTINPTVKLLVANLSDLTLPHQQVRPPQPFHKQDYYLTSASWVDNEQVSAIWLNRAQNLSVISVCSSPKWICEEVHVERAPENGWVDIQRDVVFSMGGGSLLTTAQVLEGDTDVYTQIKHITIREKRIAVISQGRYQVDRILAWDYTNHLVYYMGTTEKKPGQRHLYVVKDPISDKRSRPHCITCDFKRYLNATMRLQYINCTYFNAYIPPSDSEGGVRQYVVECQGPGIPLAGVHRASTHHLVRPLYNSRAKIWPSIKELALPLTQTFELILSHGKKAVFQLLLPPSWREELRDAAFPMLVEFDGRPGLDSVNNKFQLDWGTYLSSYFDLVYVKLDIIGSVGEGSRSANVRLNNRQIQDHITAIKGLIEKYNYIDSSRIAVWGRGYGGYMTTMALSMQHKLFKCGIAISPITDWIYYNSAFSERVLGVPLENYKLYVEMDATQHSKHIKSKTLYLVHGVADISVPYVHSVALARSLAQQGILFRYQSYANEGHDLSGVLEHLYTSLEDFLSQCLNLPNNDKEDN